MPRGLFRKITPRSETLRTHWALKPFGRFFGDPRLWSLQRRTVTPAFGAGLAICFVPLPIHIPLAAIVAIFCRIHIPTIMLALLLANPLTFGPIYYLAYKVGVHRHRRAAQNFKFEMSWEWVQNGLGADVETLPRGLWPHWRAVRAGGLCRARPAVALQRAQEISRTRRRPPAANQPRSSRFPRFQLEDPIHARREAPVVRHDDEAGRKLAVQLKHQLEHRLGVAAIEISRGLIGQHDARIGDQRARHRGALTFAARQLVRTMDQTLAQTHALENCTRACSPPRVCGMRRTSSGIATFSSAENSGNR